MFGPGIGFPELLVVLVIILMIFGGSKLIDIGGSLGKGVRQFRKELQDDESSKTSSDNDKHISVP